MVADLPSPFCPTKAVTTPGRTGNDMPSRARVVPYRLRSPATTISEGLIAVGSRIEIHSCRQLYAAPGSSPVAAAATQLRPGCDPAATRDLASLRHGSTIGRAVQTS